MRSLLNPEAERQSITQLSTILSNEMTLYINTRKLQWNVLGEGFLDLHKLFQSLYIEIEEIIDLLAKRINTLGGQAISTMKEFAEQSRISKSSNPTQKDVISGLLKEHDTMLTDLKKNIENRIEENEVNGATDFLEEIMEQHKATTSILKEISKTISTVSPKGV
jgi:starvation-inducible DNA-binding protein